MIYHAETLGQLASAVESMIQLLGSDAPVGTPCDPVDGKEAINFPISLDLVYMDEFGNIVGDEANDYKPNILAGEVAAVRVM